MKTCGNDNLANSPNSQEHVPFWHRLRKTGAHGEKGSAIIMVLGTISICAVMIAHIVVITELLGMEAYQVVSRDRLRYQAESAADTAYWMHLNDRRLFSNRTIGQDYANDELRSDADFPPWMLDGRPHSFDDGDCIVYLNSAEGGFNPNSPDALKEAVPMDDSELLEIVEDFLDVLTDYTDSDDYTQLSGMEADDYAAEGFPTLPRNDKMEFKAEIYWLRGWRDAIPGDICIVPPSGITYSINSKQSFFAASPQEMALTLDINDDELAELVEARRLWEEEGIPLEDSLSESLLLNVQGAFSFEEAGLGIILAIARDGDNGSISFRVTREMKLSTSTVFADQAKETLSVWERIVE